MAEEQDPLAGGREVKSNQIKFGKPGDYIKGYYQMKKETVANGKPTTIYQLRGVIGSFHHAEKTMDENGNSTVKVDKEATPVEPGDFYLVFGGKEQIDDGFRKAKVGQMVGIQFKAANKSKTPGNSPFKVFKFVLYDDMDPELIYGEDDDITVE